MREADGLDEVKKTLPEEGMVGPGEVPEKLTVTFSGRIWAVAE